MINKSSLIYFFILFFFLQNCIFAASTPDIFLIGMGAKSIGMGSTYFAICNDANALFTNPAGLAEIKSPKITSLYTYLTDDVNHIVFAGVIPTKIAPIGIGILNSGIDNIYRTSLDGNNRVVASGTTNYSNRIIVLGSGGKLSEKLLWGINLKLIDRSFGTDVGSGSGLDGDFGLLYHLSDKITLGFTQQNILPSSLGGKMKWNNGTEEGISSKTKLGLSYYLGNGLFGLDADIANDKFMLLHTGFEWNLNPVFVLRAGLEETAQMSTQKATNYSIGAGLNLKNIHFDYAYRIDSTLDYNNSQYFSISIDFPEIKYIPKTTPISIIAKVEETETGETEEKSSMRKEIIKEKNLVEENISATKTIEKTTAKPLKPLTKKQSIRKSQTLTKIKTQTLAKIEIKTPTKKEIISKLAKKDVKKHMKKILQEQIKTEKNPVRKLAIWLILINM